MPVTNNRSLGTKLSLFFERKASLGLLQFSVLVALLLVGMILKSSYDVYQSQNRHGEKVKILAEMKQPKIELPTIDISASRLKPADEITPTYDSMTPFKVKEAAIILIKRGHKTSGIEILKKTPETRKLGNFLEMQDSVKIKRSR